MDKNATHSEPFLWAVVGSGPCGIIAVALLVEHLKRQEQDAAVGPGRITDGASRVAWIDPQFGVGSLARWREVQANSSVQSICSSFAALPALGFRATQQTRKDRGLRTLMGLLAQEGADADGAQKSGRTWCELGLVVDALEDATLKLLQDGRVDGLRGQVTSLDFSRGSEGGQGLWRIEGSIPTPSPEAGEQEEQDQESQRGLLASVRRLGEEAKKVAWPDSVASSISSPLLARSVVLATGALPKVPPQRLRSDLNVVELDCAIISAQLRALFRWTPPPPCPGLPGGAPWQQLRWTVVGSSHSAMLAVRNLLGLGVQHVQVVHRRPLFYVEPRSLPSRDGTSQIWLKNLGTGLLGPTGAWCRKELPLMEGAGRVSWHRFEEAEGGKATLSCHCEDWVLRNSDALVFAAGFEPAPIPAVRQVGCQEEPLGNPTVEGEEGRHCRRDDGAAPAAAGRRSRSRSPRTPPTRRREDRGADSLPELPGLVGLGIGFPEHWLDPDGDVDVRVGFVRHYIEHAARSLGLGTDWLKFEEE